MDNMQLQKSVLESRVKRKASWKLRWAVAMVTAGSGSYIGGVSAQATERSMGVLEEVVVTARRRDESLQEVPIAVTALNAEYLRNENITRLDQLGIHVPSLSVSSGGPNTTSPVISLRGQRPSDVTLTLDPAVPIYFADIVVTPSHGTNLALYDLASVQVLKGPQGTLFGRNSTGGALILTPQRPGEEFGGHLETRLGNYDLVQFDGAVDLPVNDALRLRVAGTSLTRDGYQKNVADNALKGDTFWDEDSYGVRVTMDYTPTDRLGSYTTLAYDQNKMASRIAVPQVFNHTGGLGQLTDVVFNGLLGRGVGGLFDIPTEPLVDEALARQKKRSPWDIETDVKTSDDVDNIFFANNTEYRLTDHLTVKNIFGYRDLSAKTINDADGTALPMFGAQTSLTEQVTRNPPLGKVDGTQYSDEVQLLGDAFDQDLDWIVGAFWMKMDGSQSLPIQVLGANLDWPTGPSPINDPRVNVPWAIAQEGSPANSPAGDVTNEAYAIFGEGNYTINNKWSVTAGARQSWDDRSMTAKNFSFNFDTLEYGCQMRDVNNNYLPDNACARQEDEQFDKLTWRASVNFTPMEDMLLYGSVATGYRAGGFNLRGTNNFSLQPFDPENVTTYEIGHKTDWHLWNLATMRTNLAIYSQQYDDIQKTVSGANPDTGAFETYTVNAASADINGAELEVTIAPTANLVMSVSYAYIDAGYNDYVREVALGEFVDFSGAPFEYIPENSLTASVSYTLPLSQSIGEVIFTASAYWQDKMYSNGGGFWWPTLGWAEEDLQAALDTVEVDSYTVANFRIDWSSVMGSSIDLAAFVNNAFDEEYITGGLSVPDSLGWVGATYGPPQTYGASLRYNF